MNEFFNADKLKLNCGSKQVQRCIREYRIKEGEEEEDAKCEKWKKNLKKIIVKGGIFKKQKNNKKSK